MPEFDRITLNRDVMGGKPCIRGMRITVDTILGLLAADRSAEEILAAHPFGRKLPGASGSPRIFPVDSGSSRKYPEDTGTFREVAGGDFMPYPKADEGPHLTPEVSLRGRNAWVVECLADGRGKGQAEAAAWIIDQWISSAQGRKDLLEVYGIDVRDYQKPAKVVNIRGKKHGDGA